MKIKVADTTPFQLDQLVALCVQWLINEGCSAPPYSTDWSLGGPIIEREEIELHVLASGVDVAAHPTYTPGDAWEANLWPADLDIIQICGPTPLVAAMRCYVASKLGDEVEVPDELANNTTNKE